MVRGLIWPNFKLILALMYIIVTWNYKKDFIKNRPEDQWSCKCSPDVWAYCKYRNKFRQLGHCLKMGQGKLSVIVCITFVKLENILFHAKFHDRTTISPVAEDFGKFLP